MKNKWAKLSIAALGGLHCVNELIDHSSTKENTNSKGKYYNWDRGDIYYTISGKGEPVLLVHDLNIFSSEKDWAMITSKLAKTNTVYTIDLPGCGNSEKLSTTYTNYMYVQFITDFVKVMIKESTTVVVSGFSASFIMMANYLDQDLFRQIILINPPTITSLKGRPDKRSKALIRFSGIPIIGRTCYYIATNRTNTEYYLSEECFYNPFHMKQMQVQAAYRAAHIRKGNGRYLYASLKGNYLNTDITKALEENGDKVVVFLSSQLSSASEVKATYQQINKNIAIEIVENAKLFPQMEMSERICEMIQTVINKEKCKDNEKEKIIS